MKPKKLIPFVVILVALVGLVVWRQSKTEAPSIVRQANLAALVPQGLDADAVTRLSLYAGGAPEEKVVLEKSGEDWSVSSHFGAPVDKEKLDEYLDMLLGLQGEPRDTASEDSKLDVYELKDDQAFHVEVYKDGDSPALHLLVGKAPDHRSVFLRTADARDIYVESDNPRQDAGISTTGADAKPDATHWFEKDILTLEQDRIKRVALTLPDKSVVLERTEKTPEPAPEVEAAVEDGEDAAAETPEPTPAAPEIVWELVEGGPGIPLKEPGVQSVLQKIATFVATDIVDPAKKAEWGLENPAYRAEIGLEGDETIVLEGGRPDPTADGYVRVASSDKDVVYQVNKFNFERLFVKGSQLFDLPKLTIPIEQMGRIEIFAPEGQMVFLKGAEWNLLLPPTELDLQTSTVNDLASTLANLTPADYADANTEIGEVTHEILIAAGAEQHVVKIAGDSQSAEGRYVLIDDNPMKLVLSQNDSTKLTPSLRDVLNRSIFDVPVGDVQGVGINHDSVGFSLVNRGGTWERTLPSGQENIETDLVDDLLFGVDELQIDDMRPDVDPATLTYPTTISIRVGEDDTLTVNFTEPQDGARLMTTSAKGGVFTVKEEAMAAILGPIVAIRDAGREAEAMETGDQTEQTEQAEQTPPVTSPEISIAPTPEVSITPAPAVEQPVEITIEPTPAEN